MRLLDLLKEILLEDRRDALLDKFVKTEKVSENEFKRLYEADPTIKKSYATWILNRFVKEIKASNDKAAYKLFFENLYKLTESLELFDRIKRKFKKQDINQYTLSEFTDEAWDIKQTLGAEDLEKGKPKTEKYGELKLGNVAGFTVYKIPQGREDLKPVACELGSGTNWCTAHNLSNYYNTYNKKDPLFVFIKGDEKYQYHIQSNQFMDKRDHSMPEGELRTAFEDFIEKVEGRFRGNKDLSGHLLGSFKSLDDNYEVYKVGSKFYTKISGKNWFYDPDVRVIKDQYGNNLQGKLNLDVPYLDFIKFIYTKFTEEEKAKLPNIYKVFAGLADGSILGELKSLDLSGTKRTTLPGGLKIAGNLVLTNSNIKEIPKDTQVGGSIFDFEGNKIN